MIRITTCFLFTQLVTICLALSAKAQCDTVYVTGDMIQSSTDFLSGTYFVDGTFQVTSGVTVFVQPLEFSGCGKLEIFAEQIIIDGEINGNNAGYLGGSGGAGGAVVTSLTNDEAAIDGCSNSGDTGHLSVEGGLTGSNGQGLGGGNSGINGMPGSGSKQDCDFFGDEAGMVGGSGGSGGGSGGSYGGVGGQGGSGGNGSASYTNDEVLVSEAYTTLAGSGGQGGSGNTAYGTATGDDINMGSGGAGAGGGGRSFVIGQAGGFGGSGGASVLLQATDTLIITGSITANGSNGEAGGTGSDGGVSPDCCSDGCDDCGESTYSCGAGAGAGAGGGAGGGILINAGNYISISGVLSAKGGNGGVGGSNGLGTLCANGISACNGFEEITTGDASDAGDGGGGSGGRIKIFYYDCPGNSISSTMQVSGGTGGNTSSENGTSEMIDTPCAFMSVAQRLGQEVGIRIYADTRSSTLEIQLIAARNVRPHDLTMNIVDVTGRLLKTQYLQLSNNKKVSIPLSDLPFGVYIVQLYDGQDMISKKFVWK